MAKEIELKYCIDKLPNNLVDYYYIEQYYFTPTFEKSILLHKIFPHLSLNIINTFRIRLVKSSIDNSINYILTLKTKGQYERDEFEKKIDKETFQKFISSDIESLIIKNRYVYHLNNYKYEFDEYLNLKSKLYTCEVEFNNLNDLDKVKEEVEKNLSNYFKVNFTDVTLDGRYKNSNLHKYF